MKLDVKNISGKSVGSIDLDDAVFGAEVHEHILWETVKWQLARRRAGTAKDHSLLQEQIDAGLITPEQAATSLNKNLVTRALGVEDVVMLETNEHRTEVGDIYLMCSDGLSDMVTDEGIADIMRVSEDLDTKAKALVDAANAGGGRDNISVLLVLAKDGQSKRGFMSRLLRK